MGAARLVGPFYRQRNCVVIDKTWYRRFFFVFRGVVTAAAELLWELDLISDRVKWKDRV